MNGHDPTCGGLLMADTDYQLLREVEAAGERFGQRSAARQRELGQLHEHRRAFQRVHPEVLSAATWRAIRLALIQALKDCESLTIQVHDAELDGIQQRLARLRDKGLIDE